MQASDKPDDSEENLEVSFFNSFYFIALTKVPFLWQIFGYLKVKNVATNRLKAIASCT